MPCCSRQFPTQTYPCIIDDGYRRGWPRVEQARPSQPPFEVCFWCIAPSAFRFAAALLYFGGRPFARALWSFVGPLLCEVCRSLTPPDGCSRARGGGRGRGRARRCVRVLVLKCESCRRRPRRGGDGSASEHSGDEDGTGKFNKLRKSLDKNDGRRWVGRCALCLMSVGGPFLSSP